MTVRYLVKNVKESINFYTAHLGFSLIQEMGPAFAKVSKDDLVLWLSGPQSSAARAMPDGRFPEAGGWNRIVIETNNIEGLITKLKESEIIFRNEIVVGPGGKQIVLDDPSGNPIEIFEAAQ